MALIDRWDEVEAGGLVPCSVVVDRLLDLRNLLVGSDRIAVDALLAGVPGVNVVESDWWIEQVRRLRQMLDTDERAAR